MPTSATRIAPGSELVNLTSQVIKGVVASPSQWQTPRRVLACVCHAPSSTAIAAMVQVWPGAAANQARRLERRAESCATTIQPRLRDAADEQFIQEQPTLASGTPDGHRTHGPSRPLPAANLVLV